MSGGRGSAAKRQRPVPAPDDRAVIVNSDVVRSVISVITAYVDTILSERDELKLEVSKLNEQIDELTSKVSSLEFYEEDNTRLKNEVEISMISIENHRNSAEQFSEENKRLVLENKRYADEIKRLERRMRRTLLVPHADR